MAGGGVVASGPTKVYPGKITIHVILTSILAASGGLMFGYDVGVSGGVTSMNSFLSKFFPEVVSKKDSGGNYCKYNNQKLQAFTSTLYIAGLVATFAAAPVSRKFGRLLTMRIAAACFVLGTILCAAAPKLIVVILGRVVLGIGVGFANQAVPLFLSETAPTKIRGALNILFQLAVTIGILLANIVNYFAEKIDVWGWRLALGLAGVPAALLAIGGLILTDTPNSLIDRGKYEEGKRILKRVRGVDDVDEEFNDIVTASKVAASVKHPFRNIIKRRNRPQLVIAMLLQLFQQFTGINAIMFYAPILFQSVGFGSGASLYSAVITGAVNVLSTLVAVFIVDRAGRRILLLEAGVQMFIAQLAIAIIMAAQLHNNGPGLPKASGIIVVLLICIYVSSFAWSWGPLGWLIPSETFPLETRSAGQSITVSTNLFFTFLIAQSFLSMLCSMKFGVYLFFSGWIFIMTIFVYFFLPETKGIPIEEMRYIWGRHWYWKRFAPIEETEEQEMRAKGENKIDGAGGNKIDGAGGNKIDGAV